MNKENFDENKDINTKPKQDKIYMYCSDTRECGCSTEKRCIHMFIPTIENLFYVASGFAVGLIAGIAMLKSSTRDLVDDEIAYIKDLEKRSFDRHIELVDKMNSGEYNNVILSFGRAVNGVINSACESVELLINTVSNKKPN